MKNKRCDITYHAKYWDKISAEAKDLVHKMLHKDSRQRIGAREALQHQWFHADNSNLTCVEVYRGA